MSVNQKAGCGCLLLLCFAVLITALFSKTAEFPHDSKLPVATGAASQFDNGDSVYISTSRLNMRSSPSGTSKTIGSLTTGTSIPIIDRSGEWLKISHQGNVGWISAKYVASESSIRPQYLSTSTKSRRQQSSEPESRSWFGKKCKKGKPCGNACISKNRTCHK